MGRKNKRLKSNGEQIQTEKELREARRKLRNWQREVGHLKPVLRYERQAG